jgi:hypothetical protein
LLIYVPVFVTELGYGTANREGRLLELLLQAVGRLVPVQLSVALASPPVALLQAATLAAAAAVVASVSAVASAGAGVVVAALVDVWRGYHSPPVVADAQIPRRLRMTFSETADYTL